ncbi:MAG: hypothetical protein JHC95_07005 [Solirubrobacteraceae bacterium]|nr:hypothetical protein [Solirubrobacteraceae bacterium]
MLFDLRAGGRRRLVQVVYLFLALLLGGGLVFFGIGGSTSGGLFDAFREDSSQTQATEQFQEQLDAQEKKLAANPKDAAALAATAKLHYQIAGAGENFNTEQGRFTAKGLAELRAAERAWAAYIATEPKKVDTGVALYMVQAFGQAGLDKPDEAVNAMELYIDARPESSNLYAQLAVLAYTAGQSRKGDLAAKKAVSLAPEDERKTLKEQLDSAKTQALTAQAQQAQQQSGGATSIAP